jgi:hypothetical protein
MRKCVQEVQRTACVAGYHLVDSIVTGGNMRHGMLLGSELGNDRTVGLAVI